jgi:hypothetical protein
MQEHELTRLDDISAVPAEEQIVAAERLDLFEKSVIGELDKIRSPKGNWVQTLVILSISLALFVGLGMRDHPVAFTAILAIPWLLPFFLHSARK